MPKTTSEPVKVADSQQLAGTLRRALLEGRYSPAEPFPSLRDLSRQHQTGLRVTRTAVDILVKEGLLYRRERSGTFVRRAGQTAGATASQHRLRCVNILERPTGTLPTFVRTDYLHGHTEALETFDVKMRVVTFPKELERLPTVFSEQYPFQEQGCILINIVDGRVFEWLRAHGVPFVVQNYTQYDKASLPPHHSVAVNKIGGAFAGTQHLVQLGHRRIGYAGNTPADSNDLLEVYEGYAAAMRCAGLEIRTEDIAPISTDEPHMAVEPALRWMKGRPLPTAIIARTDSVAIGLLRAAQSLGLRVPQDLSVIGFNDQYEAESTQPALTTVAVPRVQLGRTAVEILMAMSEDEAKEPVSQILNCQLVVRGSTASPVGRSGAQ